MYDKVKPLRKELKTLQEKRSILKKVTGKKKSLRSQFIKDNQKRFSITAMCRVISVSTMGFYDGRSCPESSRR
ncbi:MAG: hypothetical protein PUP46_09185 [Endozoicomonas sp. (ex Botrylloides leachii)]|nr:hypothetical protein [Endozoicomonas sp. (ex Botrylloides leachii)]